MSWEIEVDGKVLPEKYDTEDAANQAAANHRGQDWSKKINVRESGTASASPQSKAQPQTGKVDTQYAVTGKPEDTKR